MAKRRSRGDGGLHWSESRQRWIAEVTVGYTPAGKRIVRTASDRHKSKALEKLHDKLRDLKDGLPSEDTKYTVAQAVTDWLEFGLSGRDENTLKNRRSLAENHVIPDLGSRKLRELTADDVDRWLATKSKTLSTKTLREIRSVLKRAVERAQARDRVKRNVVLLCEGPDGAPVESVHVHASRSRHRGRRESRPMAKGVHRALAADRRPHRRGPGAPLVSRRRLRQGT